MRRRRLFDLVVRRSRLRLARNRQVAGFNIAIREQTDRARAGAQQTEARNRWGGKNAAPGGGIGRFRSASADCERKEGRKGRKGRTGKVSRMRTGGRGEVLSKGPAGKPGTEVRE